MSGRSKKYESEQFNKVDLTEAGNEIVENNAETHSVDFSDTEKSDTEKNEDTNQVINFFKKEYDEKILKLEQDIFDYRDKLVRKAAEFENYKKRTSDEFIRLIGTANEDLILKLLPIIDDIERFQKNYGNDIKTADLKKGVDMIFEKLHITLKNYGLDEIDSINSEFNPDFHDALLLIEKEGAEPNTVVDQHEKGYKLKNKVIRHAKVIVSK